MSPGGRYAAASDLRQEDHKDEGDKSYDELLVLSHFHADFLTHTPLMLLVASLKRCLVYRSSAIDLSPQKAVQIRRSLFSIL